MLSQGVAPAVPQEQASWVCRCEDRVVQRLEQDFKVTLQQQNSLEQWAAWLDGVVSQVLKPYQGSAGFPKAAKLFLLKWSFYRCAPVGLDPTRKGRGWRPLLPGRDPEKVQVKQRPEKAPPPRRGMGEGPASLERVGREKAPPPWRGWTQRRLRLYGGALMPFYEGGGPIGGRRGEGPPFSLVHAPGKPVPGRGC